MVVILKRWMSEEDAEMGYCEAIEQKDQIH